MTSTLTIYSCLERKCSTCHQFFTLSDYQIHNYQLTFLKVLKITNSNLAVQVQLSHKSCCSNCTSYLQDLYQKPPKKLL